MIELTEEEAEEIWWDDIDGWELVADYSVRQSRWLDCRMAIVKHQDSGQLYRFAYDRGLTELQECAPFEHTDFELIPVRAIEKTVVVTEYLDE